jgi:hypothetical protein
MLPFARAHGIEIAERLRDGRLDAAGQHGFERRIEFDAALADGNRLRKPQEISRRERTSD